jgi:indole-3-glycerol phosphate synthase
MNILDRIAALKKKDLEKIKQRVPLDKLIWQCEKIKAPPSFFDAICVSGRLSIIAEMKKKSPSAGLLMQSYSPSKIAKLYRRCGAGAISVLTEKNYFMGDLQHLRQAKQASGLPVLRKDFIADPYEIYQAKAFGASAVLLIMAILKPKQYGQLLRLSRLLDLDALVEVHSENELDLALKEQPRILGINNRNLKTLSIDLKTTFKLMKKIPKKVCVVSESGIQSPETIVKLKSAGVCAALIGESILKSKNMEQSLRSLVEAGEGKSF